MEQKNPDHPGFTSTGGQQADVTGAYGKLLLALGEPGSALLFSRRATNERQAPLSPDGRELAQAAAFPHQGDRKIKFFWRVCFQDEAILARARSGARFIAVRRCEGSVDPTEHAAPVETASPSGQRYDLLPQCDQIDIRCVRNARPKPPFTPGAAVAASTADSDGRAWPPFS